MPTTNKKGRSKQPSGKSGGVAQKPSKRKNRQFFHPLRQRFQLQDLLLSPDYILSKIFRKDGPPLGVEFDSPPHEQGFLDYQVCNQKSLPVRKHGIGKGLMTVWRVTNPDGGDVPTGVDFCERPFSHKSAFMSQKPPVQKKKKRGQGQHVMVEHHKVDKLKQPRKGKCELALEGGKCQDNLDQFAILVDDEELELRELQAGPNPLTCSAHFATNGLHGCSLCKDLLAKFPSRSVSMKQPLSHPWVSAPELVKKLFKIFHFLCTYGATLNTCSFTLDEFAEAFYEKDSLLLGKVNVALLELLLSDVEAELSSGASTHMNKNCKFLGLLHSVEHQDSVLKFWKRSVNSLTWTEILCQVFVAAGFGSKQGTAPKEVLSKEATLMTKYGLSPGTLQGELFTILSLQGNNGMRVSDLSKCPPIVELNLGETADKVELLICSMLSSDITLFEKISSSTYRLRNNFVMKESDDDESDSENFGSVDDDSGGSSKYSSGDDSGSDSGASKLSRVKQKHHVRSKNNMLTVYNEIDESYSGEIWLLGLLEGEYSELSIEEKLNALLALIDLVSAGSSIRIENMEPGCACELPNRVKTRSKTGKQAKEDVTCSESCGDYDLGPLHHQRDSTRLRTGLPKSCNISPLVNKQLQHDQVTSIAECVPNFNHFGSGAKIKRSMAKQQNRSLGGHAGQTLSRNDVNMNSASQPVDSRVAISKMCGKEKSSGRRKDAKEREVQDYLHPMQSIFLGSDRRYNRYWLFLGPCNAYDPGHKRIYFESSEDGHWEVIDTEEALCTLLSALDRRGTREAHLLSSLEKREMFLCRFMTSMADDTAVSLPTQSDQSEPNISREDSSSAVSDVDNLCLAEIQNGLAASTDATVLQTGKNGEQKNLNWSRIQAFDAWIWSSFYSDLNAVKHNKRSYLDSLARCEHCHDLYWRDEKHCKICHTTFELDFDLEERYVIHAATCRERTNTVTCSKHKILSSQLQSLKAAIYQIELVLPEDALGVAWKKSAHNLWVKRLRRTSTLTELRQVLADFVSALSENWLYQCIVDSGSSSGMDDIVAAFSTMSQTSSAVALWLVKLDILIAPHLGMVHLDKEKGLGTRAKALARFLQDKLPNVGNLLVRDDDL
ncbi:hypothetical protein RJ639_045835 [Escallonia herrerae]|uniref:DDT domain-containing protein n=1 Tax=Escallonia herrerae TaxID=1293975 RepID=A0AA88W355_9ASTE|nr:hypothetical protein RJ639_045835 [Escallonia herrerae]